MISPLIRANKLDLPVPFLPVSRCTDRINRKTGFIKQYFQAALQGEVFEFDHGVVRVTDKRDYFN